MSLLRPASMQSYARQSQAQRPVCSHVSHLATPIRHPVSSALSPSVVEAKCAGPAAVRTVAAAANAPDVGFRAGSSVQTGSAKAEVPP